MDDGAETWQATLQASESLEALQDALFSAEEVIQSHSQIWDSTDVSAARLLVRLDEVRDRLSQAREAAQKACMLPPTTDGPQRLSHAVTSIHSQFHKIHADALDLELKLESERAVLTTYDVCMQCERLLHNLESSSASETPSSKDAWEAKRRHMSSTCAHLLSTMRQSLPAQPKARARFAQIEARWNAIQPPNHVDDVQETTDMLASSLGISTPMSKRLANEEEDARKRRWSLGTPSRLPRTPSSLPRTPSHTMPRITSSAQRPRTTGRIRSERSASTSTSLQSPGWMGQQAPLGDDSPSQREPTRPRSAMDRPKTPNARSSSSLGKRPTRRTSLLPRPSYSLAQGSHVPPVPPMPSVLPVPVTPGRYTPNRHSSLSGTRRYIPDMRDALDIGVARICNARGILVERLDEPHIGQGDVYHRYMLLSKTVTCRLLRMVCIQCD